MDVMKECVRIYLNFSSFERHIHCLFKLATGAQRDTNGPGRLQVVHLGSGVLGSLLNEERVALRWLDMLETSLNHLLNLT